MTASRQAQSVSIRIGFSNRARAAQLPAALRRMALKRAGCLMMAGLALAGARAQTSSGLAAATTGQSPREWVAPPAGDAQRGAHRTRPNAASAMR
ncbi:MAG: hypothetical protein JWP47_1406 [Polaromonas sp.]|nr:hypothetical protein [Polaromonas sp.]